MPDALQVLQAAFQSPQNRTETQRILQNLATTHTEHRDLFTRLANNQNLETLLAISGGSNIGADTFGAIAEYAGDSTSLEIADVNHLEFLGTTPATPPGANAGSQAISLITELNRADTPIARIGVIARLQQLRIQNPNGIPLSEQQIQQLTNHLETSTSHAYEALRRLASTTDPNIRTQLQSIITSMSQQNLVIQQILGIPNPTGLPFTQAQRNQLTLDVNTRTTQAFTAIQQLLATTDQRTIEQIQSQIAQLIQGNIPIQQALGTQNPGGLPFTQEQRNRLTTLFNTRTTHLLETYRRLQDSVSSQVRAELQVSIHELTHGNTILRGYLATNP